MQIYIEQHHYLFFYFNYIQSYLIHIYKIIIVNFHSKSITFIILLYVIYIYY